MPRELDIDQFAAAVYDVVRLIPKGRATSYGAIAKALGYSDYSRLVGYVMRRAGEELPAHRVVNSSGMLTAKDAFGGNRMEELLCSEGVDVRSGRIRNWKEVFWDPLSEIDIQ